MNIVELPIPLSDIPAQLRALANHIEAGDYGEVYSLIAVMPREKNYPIICQWGKNDGACEPVVQLELALQWLVKTAAGIEP